MIPQVRAMSPYAFRTGKWATIIGIEVRLGNPKWHDQNPRPCYLVIFPDGQTDAWVIYDDDHMYEFRSIEVGS